MLRNNRASSISEATIVADTKTKQLCMRIHAGQIAIIAHADVDEVAADALIEAKALAVINTCSFMTGTYPSIGAKKLLEAGIPLYEIHNLEEQAALLQLPDHTSALIHNHQDIFVRKNAEWKKIAHLSPVTKNNIQIKTEEANRNLDRTLSKFIDNTLLYANWEKDLFMKPLPLLQLRTTLANRHVVVVVRGKHYREDLRMLSAYIKECQPVLLAVDGGADALIDAGYQPDIIIGDMDSISDKALLSGAEVIVHAFVSGEAPGKHRVEKLGIPYQLLPAPGTSEDVAMLLAFEQEAELIVTIGTHSNMIDFLEKGRKGMASTLLVRTKIGPKLIDAKGVSQLYQPRMNANVWVLFFIASLVPILAIFAVNPVTRHVVSMLFQQWMLLSF